MISDTAPIGRLRQVFFSWIVVLALVLPRLGGAETTPASFATGAPAGLAGTVAQDDVATLTTAWKAVRALEYRSGHDPDAFVAPIGPIALPEVGGTKDVRQTTAVVRVAVSTGLPQSRAPPLT
jgi:hypothetical protein